MRECMLCTVRRAERPFYIESIDLPVYSVEELLYFMKENLPLLDESVLNEELIAWLKEELHMRRLASAMTLARQRNNSVLGLAMPIFRETGYPDAEHIREVETKLRKMEREPLPLRRKESGDCLFRHQKYLKAVQTYRSVLEMEDDSNLGGQFAGSICNNIALAYARLFQFRQAEMFQRRAADLIGTDEAKKRWLYMVWLKDGKDAFLRRAEKEGMTAEQIRQMTGAADALKTPKLPGNPEQELAGWVREYHRMV